MVKIAPFPRGTVVDAGRRLAADWTLWLSSLLDRVNLAPYQQQRVELSAQGAAITTTAIPTPVLSGGLYRVTYFLRITRAGTVSSSATVTIGATDNSVAYTFAFAALTGNTTATVQTGTMLLRVDAATSVSYAIAYASAGATSMQFSLDVELEAIPG